MMKKVRKGFTLLELIVVMAIFSILLVGVMAITKPVSKIFKNTSLSEKTYSYANNIQTYLQGRLEYSESLVVITSDKMDTDGDGVISSIDVAAWAEDFRKSHYDNAVGYNGKKVTYLQGKIHILQLMNNDDGTHQKGDILHRVYDFTSDTPIPTTADPTPTPELNAVFFNAQDAAYNFSYALGSSNLQVVSTPPGGNSKEVYRALDRDVTDENAKINAKDLSVTIVLDKKSGGAIDVPAAKADGGNGYRAFRDPVAVQIATLPLTNINNPQRNGFGLPRPIFDPATGDIDPNADANAKNGSAFAWCGTVDGNGKPVVDFKEDIYFIYAYTDELVPSSKEAKKNP